MTYSFILMKTIKIFPASGKIGKFKNMRDNGGSRRLKEQFLLSNSYIGGITHRKNIDLLPRNLVVHI
jgi:hypothetical protein